MIWIEVVLAAAVVVLVIMLMRRKDESGDSVQAETLRKEYQAQMEKVEALHRAEMEMREKYYAEQRRADAEAWQRQLAVVNAQAESRFKELTALMMQTGTKELGRNNKELLDAILSPLQTRIAEFRKAVEEASVEDKAARRSFRDRIDELVKLNATLGREAGNLASALRGQNKVQGDWGESVLHTLLEQGGLTAGIHFSEQVTTSGSGETLYDAEGRRLRPDVVVNMPDNRKLVIDSKVTLSAWLDLCDADTPAKYKEASERLVRSVKKHVDELAAKRYQDYIGCSPDFVVMFIPVEGAYIAALQADAELWHYAWERKVSISSPTHLFAVMHVVASLWSQDTRNNNALRIADKASALYDKIMLFMDSFVSLGKSISSSMDEYDTAFSRLTSGKGNIVKATRELQQLGVKGKGKRSIPEKLLSADDSSDDALSDESRSLEEQAD